MRFASHRLRCPAPAISGGSQTLRDLEMRAIYDALERFGGNTQQAAKALGISRATLYRRLKDLKTR